MTKRRTARRDGGASHAMDALEVQRLREQIVLAWKDEPRPGPLEPHCQRPDCPAIAEYFSARSWPDIRFAEMRAAAGASWDGPMHFLSPAAFRYFLPAFLLMYLDERPRIDVLAMAIVRSVCPHEGWRTQVEGLSRMQKAAVLSFLLLVQKSGCADAELLEGIAFWQRQLPSGS